ncbi:MAG: type II toxin-antitoxin system RelE/ParE family toxin [Bryobacteraceae bacterium]|nr:type II toxin-antitoxin system RelE/ParE family toxin [Bryobacteraceae bacterium]
MEFAETAVFTRQVLELLTDEEYLKLQMDLAANPAMGAVIRGGGGIRKIRVSVGNRGKRGGARVIYCWAVRRSLILLLLAYPKNATASLTPTQTAQLANAVKEEFGNESNTF